MFNAIKIAKIYILRLDSGQDSIFHVPPTGGSHIKYMSSQCLSICLFILAGQDLLYKNVVENKKNEGRAFYMLFLFALCFFSVLLVDR